MSFLSLDHTPDRKLSFQGTEYLYFCGTSYLGILHNEDFKNALIEGFGLYGTNYGSSRISNIQLKIFEEFEKYMAQFSGAEAALSVSSGFLAGQMILQSLNATFSFIYAPNVHPAIVQNESPVDKESYKVWASQVVLKVNAFSENKVVILTNSLDPLLVERYDFSWVTQLPKEKEIYLIIDDSHGFGVIGENGSGIFKEVIVPSNVKLIVISSLGKAFGIPGGIILADKDVINRLRQSVFFSGSSPIPPAYLYAFLKSKKVYQMALNQLKENIGYFAELAQHYALFRSIPDFPVFYALKDSLSEYLNNRKVIISSFPYPSPEDDVVTRIVISSLHNKNDLDKLATLIQEFVRSEL